MTFQPEKKLHSDNTENIAICIAFGGCIGECVDVYGKVTWNWKKGFLVKWKNNKPFCYTFGKMKKQQTLLLYISFFSTKSYKKELTL